MEYYMPEPRTPNDNNSSVAIVILLLVVILYCIVKITIN